MPPVAPWHPTRPVRCFNPGDLRPRRQPPPWPGQVAVDPGEGGGYAIFHTAADGWAALGLWCLDARYLRGLTTARQMIDVFAPPDDDNPTASYATGVAKRVGEGELDLTQSAVLLALMRAIAHWEDHAAQWSEVSIQSGLLLCTQRWPGYKAARLHPPPTTAPPAGKPPPPIVEATRSEADTLNEAELQRARGKPA